MFNKPINNILKAKFDSIYFEAIEKAKKDFINNTSNKQKNNNHFIDLGFFVSEKERVEKLITKNQNPYYVKNHSSENWLLSQFSSRHFLLSIDESKELGEAVYLGKLQSLINKKIEELIEQIPKFTFNEFLSGKECKYLKTYDYYYNIEREDYYSIVTWQTDHLIKIVSYEVELLVKKYQEYCSKIENPLDFINNQINIFEKELTESINNAKELKTILNRLFAFNNVDIESFDDALLLHNYPSFFSDKIEFKRFNPSTINDVINKLKKKPNTLFSNEYIIFYSLDVFLSWLKETIKGRSIKKPFKFPVWENLLEEHLQLAKQEFEAIAQNISDYAYDTNNSKEEIRSYLRKEFEKKIVEFNDLDPKELFYLLRDENKMPLISHFKIDAVFNNNKNEYLKKLREVYVLQNVCWEISCIFNEIFDTKTMYFKDDAGSHLVIQSLLNDMVIDKELYIELDAAMDTFFKEMFNTSMPLDIHFYNHREKYIRIFEKGITRLQEVLDNAEPSKKVLYIQSRLKELRHRELKFRAFIREENNFKNKEDKYPKLFKEFLSIEVEFIKETSEIELFSILPNPLKEVETVEQIDTFQTLIPQKEKQEYVLNLLEDLSITTNGKSILTPRKKGALRGVVEALKEKCIIPNMGLHTLCKIVAGQIQLELKSELDASTTSEKYKKETLDYIKNNPLH